MSASEFVDAGKSRSFRVATRTCVERWACRTRRSCPAAAHALTLLPSSHPSYHYYYNYRLTPQLLVETFREFDYSSAVRA